MCIRNKKTISTIKKNTDAKLKKKKCIRIKPTHSCKAMINFKTCLNPPPKKNTKVRQFTNITAKIEKICTGKILISGILHKTICYTALSGCKHIKHTDIPFKCFSNSNCINSKDNFEIVDYQTVCTFSNIINKKNKCSKKAILVGNTIIKIRVQRKPCTDTCNHFKWCKFCGKTVVDSEICFVPAVNPAKASVSVNVDPANFKVELICSDLIVVCGFITKTVTFTDGIPTAKKDILVQVNIPAHIDDLQEVKAGKWKITRAEVCTGCFSFTCPNGDATLFHKLMEKDIIAVEVSNKH